MEMRFGFTPSCSLADLDLTQSAPVIYFTEHQKETFLLWKNLRELRKGKGLISDKDATEVSDFHLLIQCTPLVVKSIFSLNNSKYPKGLPGENHH